jgi:hypothetical protein
MSRNARAAQLWSRACFVFVSATAATSGAAVREPSESCPQGAAIVEVAPWVTLGAGMRREHDGTQRGLGLVAANVAATVGVLSNLRVGAWVAPGTVNFSSFDAAGGARIELQTNEYASSYSGLFRVTGRYTLILDGGVGRRFGPSDNRGDFFTARIAAGFTAPNRLIGPYVHEDCSACSPDGNNADEVCRHSYGITAGVRPFFALHRALDGSRTEFTAGLEFEPVGAGWWILGGL